MLLASAHSRNNQGMHPACASEDPAAGYPQADLDLAGPFPPPVSAHMVIPIGLELR